MTVWRPQPKIMVKALGLLIRGKSLFAAEVVNDAGVTKGVRPLGGSVEFGETWQTALVREFREELSVTAEVTGAPIVLENIFTHEDAQGHEIIFAARIRLLENEIPGPVVHFQEDNGDTCTARWFDISKLSTMHGPELFPVGLKSALEGELA